MLLRHLTTKEKIPSILSDGFLRGSNNTRNTHQGHVSFEVFDPSKEKDAFIKAYSIAKNINVDNVIELFFDADKMKEAEIEIRTSFINGIKDSKIELSLYPEITDEDLKSIGDYRFVFGEVPLKFMTEQSKTYIETFKPQ